MIITIDGFSGQGKSTVAKKVAENLNMEYISSGYYYRAITLAVIHSGLTAEELTDGALQSFLTELSDDFALHYCESELRSAEITDNVGKIGAFTGVRDYVNKLIIRNAQHRNLVIDGRDMCIVFPNALCKFVINADMNLRIFLAQNHGLTKEQAVELISRRDLEERNIPYPEDSIVLRPLLGEGLESIVKLIEDTVLSKAITVKSHWDISCCGEFLSNFTVVKDLLVADTLAGADKIIMYPNEINFHAHETLMFMEEHRPYIYGASNKRLLKEIVADNAVSEVCVKNGHGFVVPTKSNDRYLKLSYSVPDYSLCANENGLKFLRAHESKVVGIRAEFLHYYSYDTEHIKKILNYACESFEQVQLRLYDNTQPELETDISISDCYRGSEFVKSNKKLYNDLIQIAEQCFQHKGNISLLLPYIKHESEALQLSTLIKEKFSGNVDVMLETPMMIIRFKHLVDHFSTFVLGISDLISLIEGSDRQMISYEGDALDCVLELIMEYVIQYMNDRTILYITSEKLYQAVCIRLGNQDYSGSIRFMAKY